MIALPIGADPGRSPAMQTRWQDLSGVDLGGATIGGETLAGLLAATSTDAWLVRHDGRLVAEQYAGGYGPATPHPLLSVTKTIVGAVAGILAGRGLLDPAAPLTTYVPELAGSGYDGATVRDVLDMRSGVRFVEDYADPGSDVNRMEAAPAGWRSFLCGLRSDRPHGEAFEYRSAETEALGWACERAAAMPMPQLISELVWRPMGAECDASMLADAVGDPIHDGGMLATARDLSRFGQLLLDGGAAGGAQVIPRDWLAQIWSVDADVRTAFRDSPAGPHMPGGWYRSQCWLLPGPHGDLLLGLGIHGQLLRVDPATRTVIVKLSSWPSAQDAARLTETLRACDAVAALLSGRPTSALRGRGPGGSLGALGSGRH